MSWFYNKKEEERVCLEQDTFINPASTSEYTVEAEEEVNEVVERSEEYWFRQYKIVLDELKDSVYMYDKQGFKWFIYPIFIFPIKTKNQEPDYKKYFLMGYLVGSITHHLIRYFQE